MKINSNLNRVLSILERARKEPNNRFQPIENNRFIYSVNNDGKCLCVLLKINTNINILNNRIMDFQTLSEQKKKEEEDRIVQKQYTKFDFLIANNNIKEYPIILLDEDITETNVEFILIKREEQQEISGLLLKPIFFKKEKNELTVMVEEIKIKKSDIFSEQEICSGRKMILLKNGKKFIGNIEI